MGLRSDHSQRGDNNCGRNGERSEVDLPSFVKEG